MGKRMAVINFLAGGHHTEPNPLVDLFNNLRPNLVVLDLATP